MIEYNGVTYFTEDELKCKGSGKLILGEGFAGKLLELRLSYKKPMILTSACRSKQHNENVGGSTYSFHICDDDRNGTHAVDVQIFNGTERYTLAKIAFNQGWSVGVNKTFLHLDMRSLLGYDNVLFTY